MKSTTSREDLAKELRDLHEISGYPFHIEDSFVIADFIISREMELDAEFTALKARCESLERSSQRFASEARDAQNDLAAAKKDLEDTQAMNRSWQESLNRMEEELAQWIKGANHWCNAYDETYKELQSAIKERDEAIRVNHSVAVCRDHTPHIVHGDDLKNGCYVCELSSREKEVERATGLIRRLLVSRKIMNRVKFLKDGKDELFDEAKAFLDESEDEDDPNELQDIENETPWAMPDDKEKKP